MLPAAPGAPSRRCTTWTVTPGPDGGGPMGRRYSVIGSTPWPSMRTEMFSPSMMNRSSTGSFFASFSRLSSCAKLSSPAASVESRFAQGGAAQPGVAEGGGTDKRAVDSRPVQLGVLEARHRQGRAGDHGVHRLAAVEFDPPGADLARVELVEVAEVELHP